MNWTLSDFGMFAAMVAGAGLLFAIAARRAHNVAYLLAAALAVAAAFVLVWAILAVGALGEPGDPADLMYFALLALTLAGAARVRLEPRPMAGVMAAAAAGLGAVALVALALGKHTAPISSVFEVLAVNGLFAALFAASGAAFWMSAQPRARGS